MSKKRKSFLKSFDLFDWFFILVAFIAIGYGLYRAYDLGPDWWGNVAGPLFSLASGFLFVVALRMQLREHRHALEEMEQNNTNHAELLLVAKQEKRMNTCLKAIEELSLSIYNLNSNDKNSAMWIQRHGTQWIEYFSPSKFSMKVNDIKVAPKKPSSVFNGYAEVDALVHRIEWIKVALSAVDLDASDVAYIKVLHEPLRKEVYDRLKHVFKMVPERFDQALLEPGVLTDQTMIEWVGRQRKLLERLESRLAAAQVT